MDKHTTDQQKSKSPSHSEYWKSLDEKYKTDEFVQSLENEFMSSPLKSDDGKDGLARRQFMKLMGASVALSAAACVRRPVQTVIPYNKRPKDIIPGLPNYYASSVFDGQQVQSTLVKTREGRPLFIKPNKDFPGQAGLSPRISSQVLSLYDPDRLTGPYINSVNPKKRKNKISVKTQWDLVDKKVTEQLKKGGVSILTGSTPSKMSRELMAQFAKNFSGNVYYWDAINNETLKRAQELSYGAGSVLPRYHFDRAELVVSLDGDFLGTLIAPVEFQTQFGKMRNPEGNMNRLVSIHSMPSLTTLNADDNYSVKASQQFFVALALLQKVLDMKGEGSKLSSLKKHIYTDEQLGLPQGTISKTANELMATQGKAIVITGGLQTESVNGLSLQLITNWLNSTLGNEGRTITVGDDYKGQYGQNAHLDKLVRAIEAGEVKTLIVNGVNPIFSAASSFKLSEVFNKVEMIISTNNWMDETTGYADVVAPAGHNMENWDVFNPMTGVDMVQQPTIQPMHQTRSFEDSMITWSKSAGTAVSSSASYYDMIMASYGKNKAQWVDTLKLGYKGNASQASAARKLNESAILGALNITDANDGAELVLYAQSHIFDGSMNNVSWLLELPDPVTKVCWDNFVAVAPATAKKQNLAMGSLLKVKTAHHEATFPVYIQPGMSEDVYAVAVGYGRSEGGDLARNIGVNAFPFMQWVAGQLVASAQAVEVEKVSGSYELAITQGHNSMEGRPIVNEASLTEYQKGQTGIHKHKIFSIWDKHKYDGHRWAMSVDLNSCSGCSACVIACQSENNIPVVGKKYILQGREMSWIRIDRYYKGSDSNPDTVFQPVMCQHCENAPCETVCPVLATVHSDEGLNDMVYNRCVGTRYCSNNCPYKVRRFNWFYYGKENTKEPLNMALNPDVTVRTRGVMEKCTFCVQRIKEGKNTAKDEGRTLTDGEIVTACQDACPSDAIVFGDLNDDKSKVARLFADRREYTLLEEYNAAPRVRYLSKVRNTSREISGDHHHSGDDHHGKDEKHDNDSHAETHKEGEHH